MTIVVVPFITTMIRLVFLDNGLKWQQQQEVRGGHREPLIGLSCATEQLIINHKHDLMFPNHDTKWERGKWTDISAFPNESHKTPAE